MLHNTAKIGYNALKGKGEAIRGARFCQGTGTWQIIFASVWLPGTSPQAESKTKKTAGPKLQREAGGDSSKQWLAKKHVQHDEFVICGKSAAKTSYLTC
jgi:hypothetical protein